ncbi:hypothetical protein FK220_014395 [Flavobacteriaceae bacterium TP-CH-4]|uniref:Uncharacterized protein n=1 Tax=Pelagihabitans pacificus TaxID=2696054 RepID=A0A967EBQ7_9FLAO|nr:hypothetical protein [Pelagihabitans pacificus]NHF60541.1 hypothetical protein [Pelagihabitans pacificus]
MTLEIIVFVLAILFGIVWYWRESKNNKLYRLANKITHSKELQMKPDNKKGFVHQQNFLLRLVWITFLFVMASAIITFLIPINLFFIQLFASAIVGTLIGTYIASGFILAQDRTSKENLEKVFDKGKELLEDLTDGNETEAAEQKLEETPEPEKLESNPEPEQPKSARDRLRDKGMIK